MPEKRSVKELHSQLSKQSLELLCAFHWEKHNNYSSRDRKTQLNKLLGRGTDPPQGSISSSGQNSLQAPECIRLSLMSSLSCQAAEEKIADPHNLVLGGWCLTSTARTRPASCCRRAPSKLHHSTVFPSE